MCITEVSAKEMPNLKLLKTTLMNPSYKDKKALIKKAQKKFTCFLFRLPGDICTPSP
jgi:hypothetical protein